MGRPGRWWYVIGVAVAVGGFAVVMVAAVVTKLVAFATGVDSMPRAVMPATAELQLPAGHYTAYQETGVRLNGRFYETGPVAGMSCQLTDPSARPVVLHTPRASTTYTVGSYSAESLFVFDVPADGRYTLACKNEQGNGSAVVVGIRRSGTSLAVAALSAAILTSVAGMAVCALVYLRRRRWARTQPPAALAETGPAGPPPGWPGYATGPPPVPPASPAPGAGVAVAALVLGLLGLVVAAIPLAALSLHRRSGGRGAAIAAIVLSAGWILAAAGAAAVLIPPTAQGSVLATGTTTPTPTPSTRITAVPVHQIEKGDCVNRQDNSKIDTVPRLPCSDPHDGEVYDVIDLGGGPWPGTNEINERGTQRCLDAASSFIGIPAQSSDLEMTMYGPLEEGWNTGDHTVICIVFDPRGKTTGTLRGSRR